MSLGDKLRDWLDSHGLGEIILAVMSVIVVLALILVVGGYYLVTP